MFYLSDDSSKAVKDYLQKFVNSCVSTNNLVSFFYIFKTLRIHTI